MTRKQVCDLAGEDDLLFLDGDGMDDALVGVVERCAFQPVACYDYDKLMAALVQQGMDEDGAREWYDFNIVGSYVGAFTPMILRRPDATDTVIRPS